MMQREEGKSDWREFVKAVPWFTRSKPSAASVVPQSARVLDGDAAGLFPKLAELLRKASVSEVAVDGGRYELFAWTKADGERFGWLCMPPSESPPVSLNGAHRALLQSFGGIVERFNEPDDTWLLNLNDALTERAAGDGDPRRYALAFDGAVPVDVEAYYPIAIEANGNATLCHRISGSILMFAPDHAFDHVTVLSGCPEYTFYTIDGVGGLPEWVEAVAGQWLKHIAVRA